MSERSDGRLVRRLRGWQRPPPGPGGDQAIAMVPSDARTPRTSDGCRTNIGRGITPGGTSRSEVQIFPGPLEPCLVAMIGQGSSYPGAADLTGPLSCRR